MSIVRTIIRTRRLLTVSLVVAATLGLGSVAAHAEGWRTATSSGWGPTPASGAANAMANARAALTAQAAQAGETCANVTSSSTHVYTAPDGSAYVYDATASGYCSTPPSSPYTVARSATRRGEGSSSSTAQTNGAQAARAAVLASGVDCTDWTTSYATVYVAPGGAWYIYDVTANARCTN